LACGYEADDLIAQICQDNLDEQLIIISNDNDLYQILSNNHSMYDIKKKKMYTHKDFTREYGVLPMQWVDVKGLAGCQGDKVPGVPGVYVKTAIRYIEGELPEKHKSFQRIKQANEDGTVIGTRLLVELPYPGLDHFYLEAVETFELKDFLDICNQYGFHSFERDELTWRRQFNMKVGGRR
jgi:5'-3' exonuclease